MESIENSLIAKMSQMTTDDREVLIRKFSEIISPRYIPPDLAAFYMDLANWNLSTALSVFYDQNGDLDHMEEAFRLASMSSSIGECTNQLAVSGDHIYLPGEMFLCSWRITNNGRFAWPNGTRLAFIDGDPIDYEVWQDMNLEANESGILNVKIYAPLEQGDYKARFQFVTPKNYFFGESLWVVLRVKEQIINEDIEQLVDQMEGLNGQPNDPHPTDNSIVSADHNELFRIPHIPHNNTPKNEDEMME